LPLASATIMVYSTRHDQSAHRQISDRADCPPPGVFVPGRDFRYRSGIQQYRGVVVVDPRGGPAPQGSAVLSPARGKFGVRIRRLCLRAKPAAGRFRRADPAFAGRRDFREGQGGRLSSAQSVAELARFTSQNERSAPATKKAPRSGAFCVCRRIRRLLRRRIGSARSFELLALLFSLLLQLFLQFLLVFLELLRIGRRAVIGLGEFTRERQRQRQRRAVGIDRLNNEVLAFLQAGDQLGRGFVIGHATILEADDVGALQRRVAVDDDPRSVHELHAERQGHAQQLLRLAFRLDDDGGDDGLTGLDAAVLAGEANLLGAGFLTLETELGPGRVDQLHLLFRGLGGGGSTSRRGLR